MGFSTVRDIVNAFALVGEHYSGTRVRFYLQMDVVYNEKTSSSYQRWVLSEYADGQPRGKSFYGTRFDIQDALYDALDLDPEEEAEACKKGEGYCQKAYREMRERTRNG